MRSLRPFPTQFFRQCIRSAVALLSALLVAAGSPSVAATWVPVNGTILFQGAPISAMALANGQLTFTPAAGGRFRLNAPLDANGQVVLFAAADGLAPFRATLSPAQAANYTVNMVRAAPGSRTPSVAYTLEPGSAANRARIAGTVSHNGEPLCAVVLANGHYTFSCADANSGRETGQFELDVPLDTGNNDRITLFAFADDFASATLNIETRFTLSGSVVAGGGSAVDGDVNDPFAPYQLNDIGASAQNIPNPVSLGGFVNQPFSGPEGTAASPSRSYYTGDVSDVYRADLVAGQTIRLQIGNLGSAASRNDLDLYLYDSQGNPVGQSTGEKESEALSVPATGEYLIQVYAYSGASTYVLSIGQLAAAAGGELGQTDEFVPGEVIVRYAERAGRSIAAADFARRVGAYGLEPVAGSPDRAALLKLAGLDDSLRSLPGAGSSARGAAATGTEELKAATIRAIEALREDPDVIYAEPNYIRTPSRTPNDSYYGYQWHYPLINLPQAWDLTTGSPDVIVAVIDTGVLLGHPDLANKLVAGYDFISNPSIALDGDGIDANPNDPGDAGLQGRSTFHGTHVAGTVAAESNNGAGVAGVAWGTTIMPIRVLGKGGGTTYDIMQGVLYAAGLPNDSGTVPARPADIINMSIQGRGASQAAQDVINQARSQGVIIIASAGNYDTSEYYYPASYDGVVSVSAVTMTKEKAPYSNYGSAVDVAAPGGDSRVDLDGNGVADDVVSTLADDSAGSVRVTYGGMNGTSMASPHVAGVAALMKSVNPSLTPARFDSLLASGQITEDVGAAGRDDLFGWGLIDAHKAVVAAGGGAQSGPALVVSPASINFGAGATEQTLLLQNGGGGTLTIDPPTDDAAWLSVAAAGVDANNNGAYRVGVNRSGLAAGTYTAEITVVSSANTVAVPVIMQVGGVDAGADAGRQYILLVNPETGATMRQYATNAINGRYDFVLTDVPLGTYGLFSGTDHNNDSLICDAGESCGAYPTLNNTASITVGRDMTGLEFPVNFFGPASTQAGGTAADARPVLRRLTE